MKFIKILPIIVLIAGLSYQAPTFLRAYQAKPVGSAANTSAEQLTNASAEALTILVNKGYTVGYSSKNRAPSWVYYTLDSNQQIYNGLKRPKISFMADERVQNPVETRDYTNQGFDRGHMAPSFAIGKFHGREAQLETFLLTNIAPQLHDLNDGVWNAIERMEADDFAKRFGQVEVTCGPVYGEESEYFPAGIRVPIGFFKVIRRPDGQTIAFETPQVATSPKPESYLTSIDKIQQRTGLQIFPDVSPEEKQRTRTKIW